MIIGITGGTGCGKTTLLDLFREIGGTVMDCDAIYHRLLDTDQELLNAIEARFPGVVNNGSLDRKALGAIVFSDKEKLEALNRITHHAILNEVTRLLTPAPKLAAVDAIALHASGLAKLCDITVAITAPTDDRIKRIIARDGISPEYSQARIAAQPSNEDFSSLCDYSLHNSGTEEAFLNNCLAFFSQLGIMNL